MFHATPCVAQQDVTASGDDGVGNIALGFTDYPGWAALGALRFLPALPDDRGAGHTDLIPIPFPNQAQANSAYVSGQIDLLAINNVDILFLMATAPAFPPSVVALVTDVSMGADVVIMRGETLAQMNRRPRAILDNRAVGAYLLARAIETQRLPIKDTVISRKQSPNISFQRLRDGDADMIVLRAPLPTGLIAFSEARRVFDSSDIAGEVFGMVIMPVDHLGREDTLLSVLRQGWRTVNEPDEFIEAGILRNSPAPDADAFSDDTVTTQVFRSQDDATAFLSRGQLMFDMLRAWDFVSDSVYGDANGERHANEYGIAFPDGVIVGDPARILLRFPQTP